MKAQTLGFILYMIGLVGIIVAEIYGGGYTKLSVLGIYIMVIGCILFSIDDIKCYIKKGSK
ncbi:MAG: hypothetical protein KAS32_11525 [Candidatus Peribacteraceae bacterium]|nr:hypothetical protein [Candidatus Peribacteraceae bacterium]